jgi:hypothetical protein
MRSGGGSRWRRYEPRRAAFVSARPAQCRTARCSLHWCRRGSSRLHPVVPGSAGLGRAEESLGSRGGAPKGERARSQPSSASGRGRGTKARAASQDAVPQVRLSAPRLPSFKGGIWNGLRAAKLGCGRIARTMTLIRPRDSGGGGPREAWWWGRRTRRTKDILREGERRRFHFLATATKLRVRRPSHRATRGPPSPLSWGGMKSRTRRLCASANEAFPGG